MRWSFFSFFRDLTLVNRVPLNCLANFGTAVVFCAALIFKSKLHTLNLEQVAVYTYYKFCGF
jgi:hypothetical protein